MKRHRSQWAWLVGKLGLVALLLIGAAGAGPEPAEPAGELWPLVQRCIAHQEAGGDAAPCLYVDKTKGYAILKDLRGPTEFLLVATDRRWGIEDPRIEAQDAPNYFAAAWSARGCVDRAAGSTIPDSEISLAINSVAGRSDGQLHIHIDRLRAGVASRLSREESEVTLLGHLYALRHVDSLANTNLFAMIEAGMSGAIGDQTIVVTADPRGGFFVLNDHVLDGDRASGEELQVDHPRLSSDQLAKMQANTMQGDNCADPVGSRE